MFFEPSNAFRIKVAQLLMSQVIDECHIIGVGVKKPRESFVPRMAQVPRVLRIVYAIMFFTESDQPGIYYDARVYGQSRLQLIRPTQGRPEDHPLLNTNIPDGKCPARQNPVTK